MLDNPRCAANYFAPWMIHDDWINARVMAFNLGKIEAREPSPPKGPAYTVAGNGVAVIPIVGAMMKGDSKFPDVTSTIRTRQAIRAALSDDSVASILLAIDSPGGTVDGTKELGDTVRSASLTKPVVAQIEDMGASAAYWVASQAQQVYATATSLVGSIGTVTRIVDSSQAAESEGIRVHVVSSGGLKGAGTPGAPVSDEYIQHVQELVNGLNRFFLDAVMTGRNMNSEQLAAVSDGRIYLAQKAKRLGLIDGIQSMEETITAMSKSRKNNKFRSDSRDLEIRRRSVA